MAAPTRIISKLLPSSSGILSLPTRNSIPSKICIHKSLSSTSIRQTPQIEVSSKISSIVDKIAGLTLMETAALVKELKTRLNIQDVPISALQPQFAVPAAQLPTAAAQQSVPPTSSPEEEKPPEKVEFKVKLQSLNPESKAKIIREIKTLIPGATLVEAKKFVESVPKVIKEAVSKEEAEKIKNLLEGLGATVILE